MPNKRRRGEFSPNWRPTAEGTTPKTKGKSGTKKDAKPNKTAKTRMTREADIAFRAEFAGRFAESHGRRSVSFALDAPLGRRVSIAGSFNNWEPEAMARGAGGLWHLTKKLPPGTYEYRFLVDTEWWVDPANPEKVPNSEGGFNSVIQVE